MRTYFILLCFIFLLSCSDNSHINKLNANRADTNYNVTIKYAKGFKINFLADSVIEVKIFFLPDTLTAISTHRFSVCNTCYKLPLQSFAINSTTWLPYFTLLDAKENLIGFSGLKYITDSVYTNKIANNELKEISNGREIDMEKVLELSPQVLMTYPFEGDRTPDLTKYGILNIYNADYLENTPLARTEWIKFIGLLVGKSEQADSIFNAIEQQYIITKELAQQQHQKPTVFTNRPYKGIWYVQGGNSYAANFIKDAGGNYIFADSNINNAYPADFEFVFSKALNADIWLIISSDDENFTLKDLLNEDHRYKYFKAVKTGNVIYCNTSLNQYFEKTSAQPHVVLKDIAYFLHPKLFPQYKPVYFKRLAD